MKPKERKRKSEEGDDGGESETGGLEMTAEAAGDNEGEDSGEPEEKRRKDDPAVDEEIENSTGFKRYAKHMEGWSEEDYFDTEDFDKGNGVVFVFRKYHALGCRHITMRHNPHRCCMRCARAMGIGPCISEEQVAGCNYCRRMTVEQRKEYMKTIKLTVKDFSMARFHKKAAVAAIENVLEMEGRNPRGELPRDRRSKKVELTEERQNVEDEHDQGSEEVDETKSMASKAEDEKKVESEHDEAETRGSDGGKRTGVDELNKGPGTIEEQGVTTGESSDEDDAASMLTPTAQTPVTVIEMSATTEGTTDEDVNRPIIRPRTTAKTPKMTRTKRPIRTRKCSLSGLPVYFRVKDANKRFVYYNLMKPTHWLTQQTTDAEKQRRRDLIAATRTRLTDEGVRQGLGTGGEHFNFVLMMTVYRLYTYGVRPQNGRIPLLWDSVITRGVSSLISLAIPQIQHSVIHEEFWMKTMKRRGRMTRRTRVNPLQSPAEMDGIKVVPDVLPFKKETDDSAPTTTKTRPTATVTGQVRVEASPTPRGVETERTETPRVYTPTGLDDLTNLLDTLPTQDIEPKQRTIDWTKPLPSDSPLRPKTPERHRRKRLQRLQMLRRNRSERLGMIQKEKDALVAASVVCMVGTPPREARSEERRPPSRALPTITETDRPTADQQQTVRQPDQITITAISPTRPLPTNAIMKRLNVDSTTGVVTVQDVTTPDQARSTTKPTDETPKTHIEIINMDDEQTAGPVSIRPMVKGETRHFIDGQGTDIIVTPYETRSQAQTPLDPGLIAAVNRLIDDDVKGGIFHDVPRVTRHSTASMTTEPDATKTSDNDVFTDNSVFVAPVDIPSTLERLYTGDDRILNGRRVCKELDVKRGQMSDRTTDDTGRILYPYERHNLQADEATFRTLDSAVEQDLRQREQEVAEQIRTDYVDEDDHPPQIKGSKRQGPTVEPFLYDDQPNLWIGAKQVRDNDNTKVRSGLDADSLMPVFAGELARLEENTSLTLAATSYGLQLLEKARETIDNPTIWSALHATFETIAKSTIDSYVTVDKTRIRGTLPEDLPREEKVKRLSRSALGTTTLHE